ncbi:replication initiation protein [Aeromonas salmonicida]|uniref:replication initiation protein n=1 Tax=Aeromonas salmonicida TaxID=645 RepID=UPI0005C7C3BC|nr:replication initiation protein [Aeromonas salmonicida]KIX23042.1 DNA primase [Aeromonas salmonicida subsp. salmonicida]
MVKPALQAAEFVERLPLRPYCTDDPALGLHIRPQATALAFRHIQHNPPPYVSCIVFDVDRKPYEQRREGYQEWRERGLPAPHWIAINPENADMGYVGLITKNPVHSDWWTVWHNHAPYSLDYLAEFCPDADLAAYNRRSGKEASGLGRNVTVFDNVREWGYSAVREHWRPNGYDAWADAVRAACESANAFGREQGGPLPHSEIKATAKSIARWIWRHLTPTSFADYVDRTHTPEIQARRGAKGGKVSKGGGRPSKAAELLPEVLRLKAMGYSNRDIAEDLQISAGSVSNYLRCDLE